MRTLFVLLLTLLSAATPLTKPSRTAPKAVTMSKAALHNKIKGGWAGQVIGCTFGGPTEFKFNGTMIRHDD